MKEPVFPLTNEQQALTQMVKYIVQKQWERLKIYTEIVDGQWLKEPHHQKIFNALKCLYGEQQVTIADQRLIEKDDLIAELLGYLQTHFPQDNFNPTTLAFLNQEVQELDNFHFLENLKHTYTQEKLFQQLMKTIRPTFENQDPYYKHLYYQEIFTKLRNFITLIPNASDQTLFSLKQMISEHPEFLSTDDSAKQKIQAEYYRLSATFKGLNQATQGFKKGQIITIGGYTGLGKTTLVYNLLLDLAQTKYRETHRYPYMVVFSWEMTPEENLTRLLARQTQLPLKLILDKDFLATDVTPPLYQAQMQTARTFFKQLNLAFSYDPSKNINYIVDLLYRLHLEQKVEIVVIDHLQITKSTNHFDNDRLAIDEIMTKLKEIAIKLKIVIIILSQFSRDTYSNYQGKSPEITALKGSGGIETNSDIVLMMAEFQPQLTKDKTKSLTIYNSTCQQLYSQSQDAETQKIIELNIKKNRSGSKKTLVYHFEMVTQTFQEIGYVSFEPSETR
ncbi:MAG: DnaB-like helicase C-terminal domain-containing protein [Candidatus Phytoplasma australasiaticum]|nr:DnaB-like helicase C-terminal domain-containing protein [Candidatus Phytoplasma australasiaticum]